MFRQPGSLWLAVRSDLTETVEERDDCARNPDGNAEANSRPGGSFVCHQSDSEQQLPQEH